MKTMRCAIYTRKSTSEGLDQAFTSLDAQRESAEFAIKAMAHEGWTVAGERYDDGGFTGGNTNRPALQRLIADIEAGQVDCVVVYKVDRLSRSLVDFAGLLALFDRHQVTFFSTTQNFSTTTSMGRLTLNILLSFAQFEREMISERTRDKMGAARRKGKWLGSKPPLGYDGDRDAMRLVVNDAEAKQVRALFALYEQERSAGVVAKMVNAQGWTRKTHKPGSKGKPWTGTTINAVLRNRLYVGKVVYKGVEYDGEQPAIIDEQTFERVRALRESRACGRGERQRAGTSFMLLGHLECGACGHLMTTTSACRGKRTYRYYRCANTSCEHPNLRAGELEDAVLTQMASQCRKNGEFVANLSSTFDGMRKKRLDGLHKERRALLDKLSQLEDEAIKAELSSRHTSSGHGWAEEVQAQLDSVRAELAAAEAKTRVLTQTDHQTILAGTDFHQLTRSKRSELATLMLRGVKVNEPAQTLHIDFHPS